MSPALAPGPAWLPDWRGETAIIVASGPSAGQIDLAAARGHAGFVAINNSWQLCPWADLLYASDFAWWQEHKGCPEFVGTKVTSSAPVRSEPGWNVRYIQRLGNALITARRDQIGAGRHSGFAALNLTVHTRPRKILLVGYDLTLAHGVHWHGRHGGRLHNPRESNLGLWRAAVDDAAKAIARLGIQAINCSPVSTLKNYPKMRFEEAMAV